MVLTMAGIMVIIVSLVLIIMVSFAWVGRAQIICLICLTVVFVAGCWLTYYSENRIDNIEDTIIWNEGHILRLEKRNERLRRKIEERKKREQIQSNE